MTWKERQLRSRRFWTQLSPGASILFFLSVFFLFASIGFIGNSGNFPGAVQSAVVSGAVSVVYAFLGTRAHYRWIAAVTIALFVVLPLLRNRWLSSSHPGAPVGLTGQAAVAAIIAGYLLMLFFIGTEGRRYYRLHTEVELAGEIHQALAPPVAATVGEFEFAGASRPSGMVGGDLLDLVSAPEGWLAYVADVSGHGVAAGVLMGVVKSAAHTWLRAHRGERDGLLSGLNQTLTDLLPPEKYVTFAGLAAPVGTGELRLAVAGHPPMLHFCARTGQVAEIAVENFPLGMFPGVTFAASTIACEPGDVLALYTDGMYEVCDAGGREFGVPGLCAALAEAVRYPLAEAATRMLEAAQAFGPQTDDQTLLLVRRTG